VEQSFSATPPSASIPSIAYRQVNYLQSPGSQAPHMLASPPLFAQQARSAAPANSLACLRGPPEAQLNDILEPQGASPPSIQALLPSI
jgi:hypothetical protein